MSQTPRMFNALRQFILSKRCVRIPPPLEADLYTQISKHLVNKTLLIVEDCNKQDEKGRKRKVKGGKYERRLKKCQGTHKKEQQARLNKLETLFPK